jgi:hypothetical protein
MHHTNYSIVTIPWRDSLCELIGDKINQQIEQSVCESNVICQSPQELSRGLNMIIVTNQNIREYECL